MTPKPKPMTFTRPMVPLIMADLKTQSRRIMRVQPESFKVEDGRFYYAQTMLGGALWWTKIKPPHQPGDVVYVAEGYKVMGQGISKNVTGIYLSDENYFIKDLTDPEYKKWRARKYPTRPSPARFMYASLARTWLEILDVKAERIQDISGEDAKAEGCTDCVLGPGLFGKGCGDCDDWRPILWFENLWNSIHGPDAWERNDWVWAYKFKRCEKPEED